MEIILEFRFSNICVYVHVNKIIWCEYNNGGGCVGGGGGGGGGARVKLHKLGGGACPKSLKTPGLNDSVQSQ